jgi:hypothetical protein
MKTFSLLALATAASVTALSGHTGPLDGHTYNMMRRHRQLSARAIEPRAGPKGRFSRVVKRKTPGTGDTTGEPANMAPGSFGADEGCAVWHTVSDGEGEFDLRVSVN